MIIKGASRDTAWFAMLDNDWSRCREAFEAWLDPLNFEADGKQEASRLRVLEKSFNDGQPHSRERGCPIGHVELCRCFRCFDLRANLLQDAELVRRTPAFDEFAAFKATDLQAARLDLFAGSRGCPSADSCGCR